MPSRSAPSTGEFAEDLVTNQLGLDHPDDRKTAWHDAETGAGQPVEVKACKARVSNDSGTVPGRWWIQRDNHERLIEGRGLYALLVYTERSGDDLEVAHLIVLPARLDDEVYHRRSVVECSVRLLKQRYGDRLTTRVWYRQFRELTLKAAVKNIDRGIGASHC